MTDDNGATRPTVWLAALQDAGQRGALYVGVGSGHMTTVLANAARYDTEEEAQAAIATNPWPTLRKSGPVLLGDVDGADHGKRCKCCGRLL